MIKRVSLLLLSAMTFAACSSGDGISSSSSAFFGTVEKTSGNVSQQVYHALLGELYGKYGDIDESLSHYMKVVETNDSVEVAKRVTELASRANKHQTALEAAEQWVNANQDSIDAHQYMALLNIRLNKPKAAAKELLWIQKHLNKKGKQGFTFVASLVSFETNKESAYNAFKYFASESENPEEANLALAALAINAGNFEDVLKAVEISKKSKDQLTKDRAYLYYAKAMMSLDREKEAVKVLAPIVKDSNNTDLRLEYARLLVLSGEHDEAKVLFQQLAKQNPDNVDILYTLGLLYIEIKKYDEAQPLFEKLVTMDDTRKSGESYYFLGKVYEAQNKYEQAIDAYGEAENTSFYQEAEVSKTQLIFKEKGLTEARKYLQGRIDSSSDDEEVISLLSVEGQLLYEEKQYEYALGAYQKILDIRANDFDALYSRSLVHSKMGDIDGAEKDLLLILEKEPDNVTALNALGYTLAVYTKRYKEAKEYIAKALELRPDDPAIIDSMGWVEFQLGNFTEAEKLLRNAYETLPDPEVASHLIEVLSKTAKTVEAKELLRTMLEKHPNDEELLAVQKKISQVGSSN